MPKPKVFVTREIPQAGLKLLREHCQVRIYPKKTAIRRQELIKGVKWCDALLCLLTEKIDKEIIDANPNLKIIANYAVGYDNIDVKYATKKGIPVANTPGGASSEAVAEHTLALIMAITKRLHEADSFVRAGKYTCWQPMLLMGMELRGKTLGIIGTGKIGATVAEKAYCGLAMKIIYCDIIRNKKIEKKCKAKKVSLTTLLKNSDIISLHVPLLPSTRHLIGKKELAMMKKDAYLINTSRGAVVDEKALIMALSKRKIAGAALDVYECEPKLTPGLAKLSNTILTPHIASATVSARKDMAIKAAKNILAALKGRKIPFQVNRELKK
jgi:glyoxylate reductase